MRKIILTAALIAACASPALAMTRTPVKPDSVPVPVPQAEYDAVQAEDAKGRAAASIWIDKNRQLLPELTDMTHEFSEIILAKEGTNYTAFKFHRERHHAAYVKLCTRIGGC